MKNKQKYDLEFSRQFTKQYRKLIKGNNAVKVRIEKTLRQLKLDPKVCSHKVGDYWSARVTGDLRIIWDYQDDELVLLLIKIGGHSGNSKVYETSAEYSDLVE